ncbi:uncharacterized protein KY384_008094 [Bacidia gigantensis]|uniref:uncharacterized protein n=1 Tax=Bacidia gigantensis TaxID=2732470 RepID=UPI001D05BC93|nr:uncharacterized protein KY384_008094 [Bacidia gigantensis]KAG8526665.1 hypothetical protein KY384_008094 [Bacidia gigantensis]
MDAPHAFIGQTNNLYPPAPPLIPPSPTQPTNGSVPPTSTVTKRRRISGATSRGVSNLTPEQLQKKRANDREAQRAIRERTRNQIETLEKRIQELTSQDPFVDLQDVVREKELVAAENEELKRKLSSIANLAQQSFPIANVLNQPAEVTLPPFSTTATAPLTIPSPATVFNEPISVRSSASTGSNYSASPSTTKHTPPIPQPNFLPGMLPQLNAFGLRNRPIDDKMGIDAVMSRSRHNSREHQMQQRARSGSVTAEVLPQDPLAVRTVGLDARGVALPPYAMPPRNTVTSCPLDTLFLDFLSDNRRQAMSGIPIAELAGPPNPSFISLIEPNPRSTAHPLSRVFTDMLHTFPSIDTRPEQVAIL